MRSRTQVTQNLGGWLHRTATHLALDMLRSETARRHREIAYADQNNHEACTWAELSPCVDQALTELPEELRALLVDHYLMGKSQVELAERTGLSAATISRRVHQGLEELRERLKLKGIYALPAVLAGLLCHVAARGGLAKSLDPAALETAPGAAAIGASARRRGGDPADRMAVLRQLRAVSSIEQCAAGAGQS